MKITELFPKQKRVVGFNQYTGKRTRFALKKEGVWEEMMSDIEGCTTPSQLLKCRLYWSVRSVDELWPDDWLEVTDEEFDKAEKAVEALAAQQAE